MAFRRQVDHGVGPVLLEQAVDRSPVADIHLFEVVEVAGRDRGERVQVRRIGQLVDHHDLMAEIGHQMAAHRRADEARAAGYEYAHRASRRLNRR